MRLGRRWLMLLLLLSWLPALGSASELHETLARPGAGFIGLPWPGVGDIRFHFERDDYTGPADPADVPVFVLLHGFAANLRSWDSLRPWLAHYGHVISYDRIPFGLSERLIEDDWGAVNPYTDQAAVAQLLQLLDAWQVERAVLVGNSAGGTLAMQTALLHPQRVSMLVLLNPAVYSGGLALLGRVARIPLLAGAGRLLTRLLAENGRLLNLAYYNRDLITREKRRNAELITKIPDWDRALWDFARAAHTQRIELPEQLQKLQLPVLLIAGDKDRIIATRQTVRLAEELPAAELLVLPRCGHLPQDECPQAVMAGMQPWLERQWGEP